MKSIKLTKGLEAMVDDEDYERLNEYKWHAIKKRNTFYAVRRKKLDNGKLYTVRMHREILNITSKSQVDHIDGNGLNNCKSNIRVVTNRQNTQNKHIRKSSKYAGVSWHKRDKKWRAQISINGTLKYLGAFEDEIDARNAYLTALKALNEKFVDEIASGI